jgi:hypothetical protein
MKTFAGFWRDGAVVQPGGEQCEKRHFFGIFKDSEQYVLISRSFSQWHQVYWLDTTTPTELSPQEAFECHKVIWPSAKKINKSHDGYYFDCGNGKPIINWGNLTEYPPKQKWRVPTDADKGKPCRVKDKESEQWYESRFLVTDGRKFLARRDEDSYAYPYDFCEVQYEN